VGGKPQREHGVGDGDGDGSHGGGGRGSNADSIAGGSSGGGDSDGGAAAESRPASSDGATRLLDARSARRRTARCRRPRVDAPRHLGSCTGRAWPTEAGAVGRRRREDEKGVHVLISTLNHSPVVDCMICELRCGRMIKINVLNRHRARVLHN